MTSVITHFSQSIGKIDDMKRTVLALFLFGILCLIGCAKRQDPTVEPAAPSQEHAVPASTVSQSTSVSAPTRDPLDGAEVRVAESHVSSDGIRVIVARNETTGRAVFFACKPVMQGGLIDHTCPQPRLRITYTLEPLAGSSVTYWMHPKGDTDRDNGKHLLVRPFTP